MGFLDLFFVALMPLLKVLLITAVGFFISMDHINLLGTKARKNLNNIIFYVLSPSLVASNLAETITSDDLVILWFMPINILLTFIIGSAFAWILIKVTRTPPQLRGLVIGACSAGNLGNLLLIIIPAICEESNSPFGDSSVCLTYGEAYVSFSMAVGAIYLWSYVYAIMRVYASKSTMSLEQSSGSCSREPLLPPTDPHTDAYNVQLLQSTTVENSSKVSVLQKSVYCIKTLAEKMNLKKILAPSTIAAIVGFIIGTVSPIRKLIIGESAPLRVIDKSTHILGEAAIPCITLVIGANLRSGLRRSGVGGSVIIGIVAVKCLVLPVAGIGIVKAAKYLDLVKGSNLLYQFVLLIQYAVPPAMNVGTITQLFEAGQGECSVILLWTYAAAAFSLTLWSTFYMWILA